MIYYIAAPGLATSDSTQALQAAAFPTIPYPGVGQYHLSHNGNTRNCLLNCESNSINSRPWSVSEYICLYVTLFNFILETFYQPSLDASVYLNVL